MRQIFRTAAAIVAAVFFTLQCTAAPSVTAGSSILTDADTGAVLFSQNENTQSLIASTTKIMTALVVLEHCDADCVVTIPPEATGIEGSSIYLKAGEQLTVRDLLYGMMLHSGNDSAVALALACSGSVEAFAELMNQKAQELALQNTHFANPNGLDSEENYSTAADLATLTQYALQNTEFVKIVSTRTIRIGERCLTNHNKLLWRVDGAIGVKTGYTKAAGRILVSAAERNGRRLIAVTINDPNDWHDHSALYDFGFSHYEEQTVFQEGEAVAELTLLNGSVVSLTAAEDFSYALSEGEKLNIVPFYPRAAFCAGEVGTPAGIGGVFLGTRCVGTIQLLWGDGGEIR